MSYRLWIISARLLVVALILTLLNIALPSAVQAADPTFTTVNPNKTSLDIYDKFELTIDLNATYDNPFRSNTASEDFRTTNWSTSVVTPTGRGVALDAVFTSPSGKTIKVPGFWDVDYVSRMDDVASTKQDDEPFAAVSAPHWHIRFTPKESGTYQYYLTVKDAVTGDSRSVRYPSSGTKQFTVSTNKSSLFPHGFLTKSTTNPGYLAYEDGTPYTQFGITGVKAHDIKDKYPKLQANGGDFVRYWLTNGDNNDIYRRTGATAWRSKDLGGGYNKDDRRGSGRWSFLVSNSAGAANAVIMRQENIGVLADTCYAAGVYVKTTGFSGGLLLSVEDDRGNKHTSSSISGSSDWRLVKVAPFKTAGNTTMLNFYPRTTSSTNGAMRFDEAYIYETNPSGSGCSETPKTNYNLLWDPSFELANSMGNAAWLNPLNLSRADYWLQNAEAYGQVLQVAIFDYKQWSGKPGDNSTWSPFFNFGDIKLCGQDIAAGTYRFWDDAKAINQQRDVLRYIIARYGYSPALGLWELTNEMCPNSYSWLKDWIANTAQYLHDNDPYRHLVTNSYWYSAPSSAREYEQLSQIDVNSVHYYMMDETRGYSPDSDELVWAIKRTKGAENHFSPNPGDPPRAWLSGEFGLMGDRKESSTVTHNADLSKWDDPGHTNWIDTVSRHDTTGIFFHNAVWGMLMANAFKSSVSNWWKEPFYTWNYQNHYKGPSTFAQALPFRDGSSRVLTTDSAYSTYGWGTPVAVTSSNSDIRVLGRQKNNQAYLWVQNKNNTWGNRIKDNQSITDETGTITIPNFAAGDYTVKQFDTITGAATTTGITVNSTGKISLTVNLGKAFDTANKPDTAFQIMPASGTPSLPAITLAGATPVTFEAEDSRGVVTAPLSAADDTAASGSRYLHTPNGTGNNQGSVLYQIDATGHNGNYYLWARVWWTDTAGNSLTFALDNNAGVTLGNDESFNNWHWVKLANTINLTATHSLLFTSREDGSRLDKLVLTTDANYNPEPLAHLQITKSGPATAAAGATITYTLQVTNSGSATATNVKVADPLDAAKLSYVSSDYNGTIGQLDTSDPAKIVVFWPNLTIPNDQSQKLFTIKAQVK